MQTNPFIEEADILEPILVIWKKRYDMKEINDVDFAASYILAYLAIRFPSCKFIAGKLNPYIEYEENGLRPDCKSLEDFPELVNLMNNEQKLIKYLGNNYLQLKIVDIYSKLRWKGIKKHSNNYVNHSILNWGLGKRPLRLKFYIPSPLKVLNMQANNTRVITMLLRHDQLIKNHIAPLTYMKGAILHARDPLHFLIHDLQHIEKFCDPLTNLEQVGFFKSMLNIGNGNPKKFFEKYDIDVKKKKSDDDENNCITLWQLMEYVVSDMNTWSTHLIKYVRAKWMIYNKDATDDDDNSFEKGWDELMIKYFGILKESELYNAVCIIHQYSLLYIIYLTFTIIIYIYMYMLTNCVPHYIDDKCL